MPQPKTATIIRQISLSKTLDKRMEEQAAALGLSTPEYIRFLMVQASQQKLAPKERISEEAEKQYFKDFIEFLTEDKKNPRPSFNSAEELMNYLDQV